MSDSPPTAATPPPADTPALVPSDDFTGLALATIRTLTQDVGRLLADTAARLADAAATAPIVRNVLGGEWASGTSSAAWQARLLDAEQALAIAMHRASAAEVHAQKLAAEMQEAHAHERALRTEITTILERARVEREAVTRRADEIVATADTHRAASAREAEGLRISLASLQQASLALRNELAQARNEAARASALADEATTARQQIEAEHQGVRVRLSDAQDRCRALEIELARATEEHRRVSRSGQSEQAEREARWQDQLATAQLEHARARDRLADLEETLERQRIEAEKVDRREQRLREQVAAAAARADADREETLRRAQDMVQAAEAARAAATAEVEALHAAMAEDRSRLLAGQTEQGRIDEGNAAREAALADAKALVEEIEARRLAAVAEAEEVRTRLVTTEQKLFTAQHDFGLVQRQMDKLCTAHDDLVEDHARLSVTLEETRRSETSLRARVDELRDQMRTLETERARLLDLERRHDNVATEHATASERAVGLETELATLRRWTATLEGEVANARGLFDQGLARERRLEETLAAVERELSDHDGTVAEARQLAQRAEEERAAAIAELEALRASMVSSQRVILEAEEETRVARSQAERITLEHETALAEQRRLEQALAEAQVFADQMPVKSKPAATPPARPAAPPPPPSVVALGGDRPIGIVDVEREWPTVGSRTVTVLPPGPDFVGRVGAANAGCCLANLAAPGALEALADLRTAGVAVAFWGMIVAPEGDRGLSLGPLDVLARPIDADVVRGQLVAITPKNARVLAIGSDSATFIGLRQGLMKAGMSVSIAWDLKQASELLGVVRPQVIVLDLSLPPRGAAMLLAELARSEHPPILGLIPGTAEQSATLAKALPTFVVEDGSRTRANILRAIVDTGAKKA